MNDKSTIIEYIRNKKKQPQGVILAHKSGQSVYVGFSLACKLDKFNKGDGIAIAFARAQKDAPAAIFPKQIPHIVLKLKTPFGERARRYFKDASEFIF